MAQDLLEYAVAAVKLLPDDLRNELSELDFFPKFEAAPSPFKALLDYCSKHNQRNFSESLPAPLNF
jgi:hypothetical protein